MSGVLLLGGLMVLSGLVVCGHRLLNVLIVLENMNVLMLLCCLLGQLDEVRMVFVVLMVVFTLEVVLGLVIISRWWVSSALFDYVGS